MSKVPISLLPPKEGNVKFLQDAKINAEYVNRFEPGHFIDVGPGSEATWTFDKYAEIPQSMWDKLTNVVGHMYTNQRHAIIR